MIIQEVNTTKHIKEALVALLIDCVESGSSVGFIAPLTVSDATSYWESVERDMACKNRKLIVAFDKEVVIGSVQLSLPGKINASHRAEVEKLMVHTNFRGVGAGRQLMEALEDSAIGDGRHLLVLDTRAGDIASHLYRSLGYIEAGEIPAYARSSSGELDATVFFYKQLQSGQINAADPYNAHG